MLNFGQDSKPRFGQYYEVKSSRCLCLIEILKLMLGCDSDDEI